MVRLLAGVGGTIQATPYDETFAPQTGLTGVTATVTDSAGVEVAGSPFTATELIAPNDGTYEFSPGDLAVLDTYDVVWDFGTFSAPPTQFEIVGGFLFTVAQLRVRYPDVADTTRYPNERIVEVRDEVEDTFTQCARVSFTRRGYREQLRGTDDPTILLSLRRVAQLISASIDGVALTSDELADVTVGDAWLERRTGVWSPLLQNIGTGVWPAGTNVEVFYEHGMVTPPGPVVSKALRYAKHLLVRSAFDENDRAVLQQTELGTFRMSVAGGSHYTGLPDVDAVLEQWGRKLGAIG